MLCILCLTSSENIVHIFEKEGLDLNVCTIIKQHFSLQPCAENANNKVICSSCWKALDSFHKFYQKVEEAHSKLISTWSATTVESTDILSTAIRIAGIKQDLDEESEGMDTWSSEDDSDYDEAYNSTDVELNIRRTPKNNLDQIISQYMKLACNICQAPIRDFDMLKSHFLSAHHEIGYVICCKHKFKSRRSLADHIYVDHHLVYLCDKCGQVMADCRALNIHKATPTNCLSTINVSSEVTLQIVNKKQVNYKN